MNSHLADLKSACASPRPSSEAETIKGGVSTWFRGAPAPASEGTIALAIGGDAKIIIDEADIRSVEKDGELFRVEVSAEANFLLHIDKVLKATPIDAADCGCDKEVPRAVEKSGVVLREKHRVWEFCRLICGIIVIGGQHIYVCVEVDCITLDPGPSRPK
ncbi:MAG: hypothetical protein M3Y05_00675 [Gemmatimonadota bacterium]|nr:hypothetical protein [Gemmatimonadota bacterium]